ncbi:unnamed protein product [Schistocephalus solidus]|uniref:Lectin_legB domain-containing protein n=1 Tax=Schistocephalus solidus TaxID=70667 RepID=A0A183TDF7_SCHSO|nr:unnamed protein product [Schistocephalus solidus]
MAMTAAGQPRHSHLFFITDKSSGLHFLVDTCVKVSINLTPMRHHLKPSQFSLQAAYSNAIQTYGQQSLTLDFSLTQRFQWVYIRANVQSSIVEAEFLLHFGLADDLKHRKIIDTATKRFTIGTVTSKPSVGKHMTSPSLSFADSLKNSSSPAKPYHFIEQI